MTRHAANSFAFQEATLSARQSRKVVTLPVFELGAGRAVRVQLNRTAWTEALESRFNEITALAAGWDGYRGKPVSFSCAQFAANLLGSLSVDDIPPPSLVPGSDGTVQIEWHVNGYDLEVDVLAPYDVRAIRADLTDGTVHDVDISDDFSVLATWIKDLGRDRHQEVPVGAIA